MKEEIIHRWLKRLRMILRGCKIICVNFLEYIKERM